MTHDMPAEGCHRGFERLVEALRRGHINRAWPTSLSLTTVVGVRER